MKLLTLTFWLATSIALFGASLTAHAAPAAPAVVAPAVVPAAVVPAAGTKDVKAPVAKDTTGAKAAVAKLGGGPATTTPTVELLVKADPQSPTKRTLFWPKVEGAEKYCIASYNHPFEEVDCVKDFGVDYPLPARFDPAIKQFQLRVFDKSGKEIASGLSSDKLTSNDIVTAPTEFGNFSNLGDYANQIMRYALPLGMALAVIMTIYAGILFMLSQGQPDKIKEAQEIIQGAVLGLVILILARFLVNFLILPPIETTSTGTGTGKSDSSKSAEQAAGESNGSKSVKKPAGAVVKPVQVKAVAP